MPRRQRHRWTRDDDSYAYYLYVLEREQPENKLKMKISSFANKRNIPESSIKMRMSNFRYLDGQGGLSNFANQTKEVYEELCNKSLDELKDIIDHEFIEHWFQTDEHEEAISALDAVAEWSGYLNKRIDYWRWVILALHNATQGFMVLALRGSNGLLALRDDVALKWLIAHREGGEYPEEKLDQFLKLYKKIKSDRLLFYKHSKKFTANKHHDRNMKRLNGFRNEFIHFIPRSWSLEVSGLPDICLTCLEIIQFLGWKCGNIWWYEIGRAHV